MGPTSRSILVKSSYLILSSYCSYCRSPLHYIKKLFLFVSFSATTINSSIGFGAFNSAVLSGWLKTRRKRRSHDYAIIPTVYNRDSSSLSLRSGGGFAFRILMCIHHIASTVCTLLDSCDSLPCKMCIITIDEDPFSSGVGQL